MPDPCCIALYCPPSGVDAMTSELGLAARSLKFPITPASGACPWALAPDRRTAVQFDQNCNASLTCLCAASWLSPRAMHPKRLRHFKSRAVAGTDGKFGRSAGIAARWPQHLTPSLPPATRKQLAGPQARGSRRRRNPRRAGRLCGQKRDRWAALDGGRQHGDHLGGPRCCPEGAAVTAAFDTLAAVRRLEAAGMERKVAEAVAECDWEASRSVH